MAMDITVSEFGKAGKKVTLVGKLDIAGAERIELPLATAAGSRQSIVVDMMGVDFIASIGIRHLVLAAKAVARGQWQVRAAQSDPAGHGSAHDGGPGTAASDCAIGG